MATYDQVRQDSNPSMDEAKEEEAISNLVAKINSRFQQCETTREDDEDRWLQAFHNYRGRYFKNVAFRDHEKSRVFVKVTKTKVLAAYGQLIDVLFGANKFPLTIQETRVPEGIDEYAHLNPLKEQMGMNQNEQPTPGIEGNMDYTPGEPMMQESNGGLGFPGDGNDLAPGTTFNDLNNDANLGGLEEEYAEADLTSGPAPSPEMPQIKPAQIAARRLEKLILDQIEESNGSVELRSAIFEACLLGTGIIKGPFTYNKTLHKYSDTGNGREYTPETVKVPKMEFVSIWDFYPDPNARNMEEAEFVIQRHRLNRNQVLDLANRPFFNKQAIMDCVRMGAKYNKKSWETDIDLEKSQYPDIESNRFEVLEYWGTIDAMSAREEGLELDESIDDMEEVQVNVWMIRDKVIRIVQNPFKPFRTPYQSFVYEKNPYTFFGIGVPENMDDAQQIMNGHARMAIDNLALAGNLVFDIDESALASNQTMEVFPGKIFKRQAGSPGQSIYGLKFPNTAVENMQMFDKFRQLADESTGLPSYSHGQTGVQSMTRTASGMSMLLGAASLNIKTVVKNLDDFLLKPLGEAYFQWNMQFFEGQMDVKGDLEIRASGTNSLMQKEVRSQRLTMFLQTAQSPAIAPFVKISKLISELAYSLDLDPDEILNDPEEAAIMAQIIGMQNNGQEASAEAQPNSQQQTMAGSGGVPQQPQDIGVTGTGGGNIGIGNVPQSGEDQFTGTVTPTAPIS